LYQRPFHTNPYATAAAFTPSIQIVDSEIERLSRTGGYISIRSYFKDGSAASLKAWYTPLPFTQHSAIPQSLGCAVTDDGYIKVGPFHQTTVPVIYTCGDNCSRVRTPVECSVYGNNSRNGFEHADDPEQIWCTVNDSLYRTWKIFFDLSLLRKRVN